MAEIRGVSEKQGVLRTNSGDGGPGLFSQGDHAILRYATGVSRYVYVIIKRKLYLIIWRKELKATFANILFLKFP